MPHPSYQGDPAPHNIHDDRRTCKSRLLYCAVILPSALKWSAYTGEEEQMFTILEPGTGSDGSDSGEVSNVPDSKLVTNLFRLTKEITRKTARHKVELFLKSRFTIAQAF